MRRTEIVNALPAETTRHIPVIPVRMTEAWLLGHELSIRSAAGNPNGSENLELPDLGGWKERPTRSSSSMRF